MTRKQTFVGRILKEYEGHLELVPDAVRHLPLYTEYAVRLDAINAGLPQEMRPREFLRYVLVDDPKINDDPERIYAIHKLERALNYQRGSFRVLMLAPKDLDRELPKPLQKTLERLSGKKDFWNRESFSSSESVEFAFDFSARKSGFQEQMSQDSTPSTRTR